MHKTIRIYEEVCIRLLKSGIWGEPVMIPQGFDDWNNVARLAKSQSVLGIVGNIILSDSILQSSLDSELRAKVKRFVMGNMLMHNQLNTLVVKSVKHLNDAGIYPVLLKGQGLARNYPCPELRQCGDIDLFVGEELYEKSYFTFKDIATDIDDFSSIYSGKHFHAFCGKIEFDVHRFSAYYSLKPYNKNYQEEAAKGLTQNLTHYVIDDIEVNTPSLEFNAYYIFNHLFNHFLISGIGLRHLCDWMMFLHVNADKIDRIELKRILTKMRVMKPWKVFGALCVKKFSMPSCECPFYEEVNDKQVFRVMRRILDEGNFGFETDYYKRNKGGRFRTRFNGIMHHVKRFVHLVTLFPYQLFRQMLNLIAMWYQSILKRI